MRILHIADVHLGRKGRQEHILEQLRKVVEICREEAVDLLLIAGDLFDQDAVPESQKSLLREVFRPLKERGVEVIAIAGNHDRGVGDIGEEVAFLERPERLRRGDVLLYLFPFDPGGSWKDILQSLPLRREASHQILVCHASYVSTRNPRVWQELSEEGALFLPFTPVDLKDLPIDYLALGHYHNPMLWREAGILCGYPGTIEPLSFKEEGPRKAFLILCEKDLRVEEIELGCQCPHRTLRWRIGVDVREEDLPQRLREICSEEGLFRVILSGFVRDERELKLRVGGIPDKVKVEWHVQDMAKIEADPLLQAFLKVFLEKRGGEDRLLSLGLSLLEGDVD